MKVLKSLIIVFLILLTNHPLANSQQLDKPTVIYFYTDWCSYCGIQRKQIEKDTVLRSILNNDYHFIEFNAESLQETTFNGKIYKPGKTRTHEFAKSFFKNEKQIAYPAWVILDQNHNIIFSHQGFIKVKELKEILKAKGKESSNK